MHTSRLTEENIYKWLTVATFLLTAIVILSNFRNYGMSWDEYYRFRSGDAKLAYYQALFKSENVQTHVDHYPGLFDLTLAAIHPYFPWNRITTGHLLSSLFGLAALLGVVATARRLKGWSVAFWSLLFIVTVPRFYGHISFNPKDIPFAATYIWGLYCLLRYIQELPNPRWPTTLLTGMCFGLCMSMRVGGLLLFCYLGLALTLILIYQAVKHSLNFPDLKQHTLKLTPHLLVTALIACAILLFWWPHSHQDFFKSTTETLSTLSKWKANEGQWKLLVLFDGYYFREFDLPFYYWPWMFVITTPLFKLLLIAVGFISFVRYCTDAIRQQGALSLRNLQLFMLVFTAIFPVAYVIVSGATVFDGIRHLMFVFTPLAICVGLLVHKLLKTLPYKQIAATILFIAMSTPLYKMAALHPYEYIFYNALIGGTEGAQGSYETDYWGLSNRAAVEALVEHLENEDPNFHQKHYLIQTSGPTWLASRFFPDNFHLTLDEHAADFFIANSRHDAHKDLKNPIIIRIHRNTVDLTVVEDKRAAKAAFFQSLQDTTQKAETKSSQ